MLSSQNCLELRNSKCTFFLLLFSLVIKIAWFTFFLMYFLILPMSNQCNSNWLSLKVPHGRIWLVWERERDWKYHHGFLWKKGTQGKDQIRRKILKFQIWSPPYSRKSIFPETRISIISIFCILACVCVWHFVGGSSFIMILFTSF